jgi:hypothetical protein
MMLFIAPSLWADGITNYKVNPYPNLDKEFFITGAYSSDANQDSNFQCDSFVFDENQTYLIRRFDTTYTNSLGYFSQSIPINRPYFEVDYNYFVLTQCGTAEESQEIQVINREPLSDIFTSEASFVTGEKNFQVFVFGVFLLTLFLILGGIMAFFYRKSKGAGRGLFG